ncbi:MAG: hypothetical protein L0229_15690 [Blastocatellia bacterium]|nr:hypothetical protein [Blastocatellia bacterium]
MAEINFLSLISLLGSIASLIGIPLAIISVRQARKAALNSAEEARASKEASLQARDEVEKFRREIGLISNVIDFEKALSLMDDIKSFIRHSNFGPVPDKIAILIWLLNTIRSSSMEISEEAKSEIQESVVALRKIEKSIDRSVTSQQPLKGMASFNRVISEQIDLLQPILIDLKNRIGEPK